MYVQLIYLHAHLVPSQYRVSDSSKCTDHLRRGGSHTPRGPTPYLKNSMCFLHD